MPDTLGKLDNKLIQFTMLLKADACLESSEDPVLYKDIAQSRARYVFNVRVIYHRLEHPQPLQLAPHQVAETAILKGGYRDSIPYRPPVAFRQAEFAPFPLTVRFAGNFTAHNHYPIDNTHDNIHALRSFGDTFKLLDKISKTHLQIVKKVILGITETWLHRDIVVTNVIRIEQDMNKNSFP